MPNSLFVDLRSPSSVNKSSSVSSPAMSPSQLVYLHSDVGFGNLPNWHLQRVRKEGTQFNLLVIGTTSN